MSVQSLIGKTAPAITLKNYDGQQYTFTPGESGVPTALFFYPESGSYGCTKEACQFRDAIATKDTFKPGKVQIIGISPDPLDKQKVFVEKHKLTYPVLSDPDKSTFKAYEIGKAMFGLIPVARVTFIIDKKGVIRDALDATLNYSAHSKFVDKWLDRLQAEEAKEGKKGQEAPKEAAAAAAPAEATKTEAPAPSTTVAPAPAPATTEAPVPTATEAPVAAKTDAPAPAPAKTDAPAPATTDAPAPAPAPTQTEAPTSTSGGPAPTETATAHAPEPAAAPAPAPEAAHEQAEGDASAAAPEPASAPVADAE